MMELRPFLEEFSAPLLSDPVRKAVGIRLLDVVKALRKDKMTALIGHDLRSIATIKHATGQRLFQPLNPEYWPDAKPAETVVTVLREDDEPVACCGTRRFELDGSLRDGLVTGRLLYADPSAARGGYCRVEADAARDIEDCRIALTGGIWVAPRKGRQDLVARMMRLHHTWVLAHWLWTWMVGFAEQAVTTRYGLSSYGYHFAQEGIEFAFPEAGVVTDTFLLAAKRRHAKRIYLPEYSA